jgi:hypothetical protein
MLLYKKLLLMTFSTTLVVGTKIEVEVDVKQLDSKVDSNVQRTDSRLADLDKEVGTLKEAIKENSDVILRRRGMRRTDSVASEPRKDVS